MKLKENGNVHLLQMENVNGKLPFVAAIEHGSLFSLVSKRLW
jgi:hypothetical protein